MTVPLRRGGRVRTDGGSVTWSVAEGVRGRRWREAVMRDGILVRALLLEVTPAGRPTRLEIASTAGLLTLHPEPPDRELHGNVVTATGIRHLRFDWSPEHEILVLDSLACGAVIVGHAGAGIAVGASRGVPALRIDDALAPRLVQWELSRRAPADWRLRAADGTDAQVVTLDEDGLPQLPAGVAWPLELG